MKIYIFIIIITLVCSSHLCAQIQTGANISTEDYSIVTENGFSRINYGYLFYTDSIGYPEIPVIHKSYAIPIDATNVSLQISTCTTSTLMENCTIYPVQPPQINGSNDDVEFAGPNPNLYGQTALYPNIEAQIISDNKVMGFRIVEIALYPFAYLPDSKILYKRDISCSLNYSSTTNQLFHAPKISEQRALSVRAYVAGLVENSEDVKNTPVTFPRNARTADPNFSVQKNVIPDYIIITNEELKGEFQRLADWKTKKGVPTIIKTVEDINEEYVGADLVDRIRNFIVDFGNKWGEEGLYLLLGGDTDVVPTREVKSCNPGDRGLYPTDACYIDSYFSNNWETNEGNSSKIRNICMGRLPVSTIQEANKYIDKLIHYEKSDLDIDYSYVKNLLMSSAFMKDNDSDGYMTEFNTYRERYFPNSGKYWYLFDHFNCECNDTVHDDKDYIYDKTYGEELNKNNFLAALNGNIPHGYPHLICHKDHGHTFCFGISSKSKGEGINNSDLVEIKDSIHSNIIFSGSCNTTNFSQDCIGGNFIKNGNSIAYIGFSDAGIRSEYYLIGTFLSNVYRNDNYSNIGYIHQLLVKNSLYPFHRLHLLGDPEMPIWTDIPQTLNVSVSPEYTVAHHEETTEVSVQVNNLPIGKSATVCIMKDTEIYTIARISDTEVHTFYFQPLTGGNITVTVTAKNFKPFEATIPVQVVEPTLTIDSIAFLSGNNGIISPGEEVKLNIAIRNNGLFTSDYVTAQLFSNSPYITMNKSTINYGHVESGESLTTSENFRFTVAPDAPEISRKEFNAVTFYFAMSKENGYYDIDTFRVDITPPKHKIVSHKCSASSTFTAGGSYRYMTDRFDMKKTFVEPRLEIVPLTSGIDTIIYEEDGAWTVTLSDNYQMGTSVQLKVCLYSGNYLTDSNIIEILTPLINVSASSIKHKAEEKSITLYWTNISIAKGFHIYRATTPTGIYTRLNKLPITNGFYIDENLEANTTYYYKVSAINSSLVEGSMSNCVQAQTLCGTMEGFPIQLYDDIYMYMQTPTTADIDYDGQKEIVATGWEEQSFASKIAVFHKDGTEPYDIDGDANTVSGYTNLNGTMATPTVSDIYGNGKPCIITVPHSIGEKVCCYSSLDEDRDNIPDLLWATCTNTSSWENAVVTDINYPDGKGEKEIIILGNPSERRITVLDCHGTIKWQAGITTAMNVGTPAVADLNNDGDKEIISGGDNKVYIWKHDGSAYGDSLIHFTSPNGELLDSAPIVCDLDGDGSKDILIATSHTATSRIFAIKQDGTCLSGFDGTSTITSIPYTQSAGYNHPITVGDIDKDGMLEVVALGCNYIKAWNHDGTLCFSRYLSGVLPSSLRYLKNIHPALADVDGDGFIDIIFSASNKIYALDNTGKDIKGFPLISFTEIRKGVTVSDIDNDGLNEIIAGNNVGILHVWKSKGKSSAIEWGRAQFDTENTSEYVSGYKDQWVITNNTTWNGGTYSNDIIVRSGTFTIPEGVTLNMRKPYRIYVMDGGTLNVNGGTITNADIVIKDGGTLNLTQNSTINLRSTGGTLQVDKGATMNMALGTIE